MTSKYLKNSRNFWNVLSSILDSPIWKRMLKLRSDLSRHIRYALGKGNKIDFWMDPWYFEGRLVDLLGYQQMTDIGFSSATVSRFIYNDSWHLPNSSSHRVTNVWTGIQEMKIPRDNLLKIIGYGCPMQLDSFHLIQFFNLFVKLQKAWNG